MGHKDKSPAKSAKSKCNETTLWHSSQWVKIIFEGAFSFLCEIALDDSKKFVICIPQINLINILWKPRCMEIKNAPSDGICTHVQDKIGHIMEQNIFWRITLIFMYKLRFHDIFYFLFLNIALINLLHKYLVKTQVHGNKNAPWESDLNPLCDWP